MNDSLHAKPVMVFSAIVAAMAGGCFRGPADETAKEQTGQPPRVMVAVSAHAAGLSAQEVERGITVPLIAQMQGLAGLNDIYAASRAEDAYVWLMFAPEENKEQVRRRVGERLSRALIEQSESVRMPATPAIGDRFLLITLKSSDGRSDAFGLRELAQQKLRWRLLRIPHVQDVKVVGGLLTQCQVIVDPDRLSARGLVLGQVVTSMKRAQAKVAGKLNVGEPRVIVRGAGEYRSVEDVAATVIATSPEGTAVRLQDVAAVRLATAPSDVKDPDVLLAVHIGPQVDLKKVHPQIDRGLEDAKRDSKNQPQWSAERQKPSPALLQELTAALRRESPPRLRFSLHSSRAMLKAKNAPVAVKLMGPNLDVLHQHAKKVKEVLDKTPGLTNVALTPERETELRIEIDRERASRFEFTTTEIAQTVAAAQTGLTVGQIKTPQGDYPLVVRFTEGRLGGIEELRHTRLFSKDGQSVPLAQLATIQRMEMFDTIYHVNGQRAMFVLADAQQSRADLKKALTKSLSTIRQSLTKHGAAYRMELIEDWRSIE